MALHGIMCAFHDRECCKECVAYNEYDDGTMCCLRLEPVEVKFRNWLFVESVRKQAKASDRDRQRTRGGRHGS